MLQTAALIAGALENARLIGVVERGLRRGADAHPADASPRRADPAARPARPVDERPLDGLLAEIGDVVGATGSLLCEVAGERLVPVASAGLDLATMEPLFDRPLDTLPIASRLRRAAAPPCSSPSTPGSVTDDGGLVASGLAPPLDRRLRDPRRRPARRGRLRRLPRDRSRSSGSTTGPSTRSGACSTSRSPTAGCGPARRPASTATGSCSTDRPRRSSSSRSTGSSSTPTRRRGGCTATDLIGRDVDELVGDGEDRTTIDDAGVAHYTGTGHRLDGSTFPEEVDVRWIELDGEPRMLVDRPRPHRAQPAPGRARPGPEDGGDRPARRGRRPRAEQPARLDRRVQPAAPDGPRPARGPPDARRTCSSRRRTGRGRSSTTCSTSPASVRPSGSRRTSGPSSRARSGSSRTS